MGINYAHETGIYSVAAAVAFACIYAPFLARFVYMSYKHPVHVHLALAVFCSFTIIAFSIRAALASSEALGERLALLMTQDIMFTVGYLILLYSSHTLVINLEHICQPNDLPILNNICIRFIRNHHLFHFLLATAIALAIAASVTNNGTGRGKASDILDIVATILFMVLTVLQAFQTAVFARMELTMEHRDLHHGHRFGEKYGVFILLLISLFYLISETFGVVTIQDDDKANNERLLYPLGFLPELLAVMLYATPGLVPAVCVRPFPWSKKETY